jgi:hypothetical protein
VDRSKFKDKVNSSPVTLAIGSSSFDGTLSRANSATDDDIVKAIKDTLNE